MGGATDPHGLYQAGIAQPPQARVDLVALDLRPDVDRGALGRLLRVWTEDIRALTDGVGTSGDPTPELASGPSGLTVTVGVGPQTVRRAAPAGGWPHDVEAVPAMIHDRLRPHWCGGDLLLQIGAGDGLSVWHAARRLMVDAAPFATPRWRHHGFWRLGAKDASDHPGRNLMGQVDGTANPAYGTPTFDRTVWVADGPEWLHGGSMAVIRRIRLDLDAWDRLNRAGQESVIGRRLGDGAPLGGRAGDPLPLTAQDAGGRPVIPADAHARLAHPSTNGGARLHRRGLNYDDGLDDSGQVDTGQVDTGLLFVSFQASVTGQFLPIQRRLDQADALNRWTTTTGSAVFAVLPGFPRDGWLGSALVG